MCFPSPGPRCSYHAHKEYVVALQRYENSSNVEEKILLGKILEDKRESYYSTPRGQNFLRREADAQSGLERDKLLTQLELGKKLRQQQMDDYQSMLARKDTSFKEKRIESSFKLTKYGAAAGLALLFLKENYPDTNPKIIRRDTILLDSGRKLLVLPYTYQSIWGEAKLAGSEYIAESPLISDVLNSSISLHSLSDSAQDKTFSWFTETLESQDYVGVASVNSTTQDVAIFGIHNLESVYEPSLKLAKRLGGTTNYFGDISTIQNLIKGTVFEHGKVIYVEKLKKTIISGIPPQPNALCGLSEDFFLGWRGTGEGGYFEVRRKHVSAKYDIVLKLSGKRVLFASGVDDEVKSLLSVLS